MGSPNSLRDAEEQMVTQTRPWMPKPTPVRCVVRPRKQNLQSMKQQILMPISAPLQNTTECWQASTGYPARPFGYAKRLHKPIGSPAHRLTPFQDEGTNRMSADAEVSEEEFAKIKEDIKDYLQQARTTVHHRMGKVLGDKDVKYRAKHNSLLDLGAEETSPITQRNSPLCLVVSNSLPNLEVKATRTNKGSVQVGQGYIGATAKLRQGGCLATLYVAAKEPIGGRTRPKHMGRHEGSINAMRLEKQRPNVLNLNNGNHLSSILVIAPQRLEVWNKKSKRGKLYQ